MPFNKLKFFAVSWLLFIFFIFNLQAESIEQQLDKSSKGLNRYFFAYLFKNSDLQTVYQICQDIDFNPSHESDLIHSDLTEFLRDRYARRNSAGIYDRKVYRQIKNMQIFETNLKKLEPAKQNVILAKWRSNFLNSFVDYLRYVNGLKKRWRGMVVSQTTLDSNLNRKVDPNAKLSPSGTSDWQQLLVTNFSWMPFVNNKKFSKNWTFRQSSNFIHIRANKHKSNEVQILDTESNFSRKIGGMFKTANLSWRVQKFSNSPSKISRSTNGFFQSYRYKFSLNSKPTALSWKIVKETSSKTSLSFVSKKHNNSTNYLKNGNEVKFEHNQMFTATKKGCGLNAKFNFDNYKTERTANSNYKSYKLSLGHTNNKMNINNFKFRLAEGISYRHRDKNSVVGDEKLIGLNVKASKKLMKKLDSSLDIKYNRLDKKSGDANQFQMVIGFNWSL
jgi:hypothetical protein